MVKEADPERRRPMNHEQFLENLKRRDRTGFTVLDTYTGAAGRLRVKCDTCGNIWKPQARDLVVGHGCNVCFQTRRVERTSKAVRKRRAYIARLPPRECVNCVYVTHCEIKEKNGCYMYKQKT